ANPGTAALGLITVAAACDNICITDNMLVQLESAATADYAIAISDQASSGVVARNVMKLSHDTGVTDMGISPGAAANAVAYMENYAVGLDHTSGVLTPPADSA